jgi:hypothetical protein
MPTPFSSQQIQEVFHPALLNRSAFSATTMRADYLAEAQKLINSLVSPDIVVDPVTHQARKAGKGEQMTPAQARAIMQAYLQRIGYVPDTDKAGGLQDLSSDRRIDLILSVQAEMSAGYARQQAAQDPDILDLFPADELYRQKTGKSQRDWMTRWNDSRSALGAATTATLATSKNGPFIALKNDPIWTAISRFGNPFPPFDYGSGMWVRDADQDEAERLGVTGTPRPSPMKRIDEDVTVSAPKGYPQSIVDAMMKSLGDRATLSDGKITLRSTNALPQ